MKLARLLPRCEATTAKGRPCRALEAVPGSKRCKYHHPALRDASIERNRIATRRYWAAYRAAKAASASEATAGTDAADRADNA